MDLNMHEEEAYASGEGAILIDEPALFETGVTVVQGAVPASGADGTGGAS